MSCLCIGGVCIPYSAILPLLLVGLQWIAAKLAGWGLLPDWLGKKLGVSSAGKISSSSTTCCSENQNRRCPAAAESSVTETTTPTASEHETAPPVEHITSLSRWNDLLASARRERDSVLVVKFTAEWCVPCRRIQPCYAELSSKYARCTFVAVDVDGDGCDALASEHEIAMMPTFLCFRGGEEAGRMSGGNSDEKLTEWVGEMMRR